MICSAMSLKSINLTTKALATILHLHKFNLHSLKTYCNTRVDLGNSTIYTVTLEMKVRSIKRWTLSYLCLICSFTHCLNVRISTYIQSKMQLSVIN